jgi:catechol 2,3-dioxygenase
VAEVDPVRFFQPKGIKIVIDLEYTTRSHKTHSPQAEPAIDRRTKIGHIHLKVADLDRSLKFYTGVLGFEITTRYGNSAVFLSAGGYHHHIGLNTWESKGATAPPKGHTGLYHFAILLPDRMALARAFKRLNDHNWPIEGAADHGVSEAIYLRDPDENGIELYTDRPIEQWPREANGNLTMYTRSLDLDNLLAELT